MAKSKKLSGGFAQWIETYFEAVAFLTSTLDDEHSMAYQRYLEQGRGGLYELAEELTDKFQKVYEKKEWDGEFDEFIDDFMEQENAAAVLNN